MNATGVADIAVIGGTGFYSFLDDAEEHAVETPYGDPSAPVAVGTVAGRRVAFLPRHGAHHEFPPHAINYRANLWALRSLGVRQVLAPCAVGGLRAAEVAPGRRRRAGPARRPDPPPGRRRTSRRGAVHLPFADPYCARISGGRRSPPTTPSSAGGTMVVIEGPRFSTRAESRDYAAEGWTLINMTAMPEAALARELRMCYAAIALVTDMDAGAESGEGVGQEEVFALFRQNLERLTGLLTDTIAGLPDPGRLHLLDLGRRHRADLRGPVKVLLTGSAGFIGGAIGRALEDAGARGGPGRPDARPGARLRDRARGHPPARRPRRRRLGPPARRRRRRLPPGRAWSAPASGSPTCRRTPATTTSAPPRCSPRCTRPGVDRLVLASSMVVYGEGRYACPEHGDQVPPPRARRGARRRRLREPLPGLRRRARLGAGRRGRPARPAQLVRRQQGRPGALHVGVGAAGRTRRRSR